jgi:hypothetical protein
MKETLDFMNELNWFLKPVANFLIWAFTTKVGLISMLALFILYVIISLINAIYKREIMYKDSSSYSSGHISGAEKIYIVFSELLKIALNIVAKVPVLLSVFVFFIAIIGISKSFESFQNFMNADKKIKELNSLISQLNKSYKVADIEVIDMVFDINTGETNTKLKIDFYDYANTGKIVKTQEINMKGNDFYFDALVLNFDYSPITQGRKINLTLPYRIFSNEVPMEQAVMLEYSDKKGIPFIYNRTPEEIYAMPTDSFDVRLKEILSYTKDERKAKEQGVRSFSGNAVHKRLFKGAQETIWIEQTGGIVMRTKGTF